MKASSFLEKIRAQVSNTINKEQSVTALTCHLEVAELSVQRERGPARRQAVYISATHKVKGRSLRSRLLPFCKRAVLDESF